MERPTRYLLMADGNEEAVRLQAALAGTRQGTADDAAARRAASAFREEVIWAGNLFGAAAALRQGNVAAVLLEAGFTGCRPSDVLNLLSGTAPDAPLILLADNDHLLVAMNAVRQGAHDYILKSDLDDPVFRHRLKFRIERFARTCQTRRRLQQAEEKKTRFESLVQDNSDAMLVLDLRGHIRFANPAAANLFRRNPASLLGSNPGIPIDDGDTMEIVIGRHRSSDTVADLRITRTTWNGEPAVLATLRDISLRKRTERALLLAKQQAELASEMKSKFLANMSHELRTPLNSIIGFTEMMQRGVFGKIDNPRYEDYLATIRNSGRHLLTLINNLLDLSKIEAGREELDEQTVDVHDLLQTAIHAEEPTAREHGLRLSCNIEGPARLLRADPVKLDQIVLNLLSNGIKFTPEGGKVTVSGEVTETGDYKITVADTGCGMNEDDIPEAMGLFSQIRSPYVRTRDRGTGLGLPIARSLAELHGGTLTITSRRGLGTQVSVTLPAERVLDNPLTALASGLPRQRSHV
ncbi:ATP-binding response regulator [Pelagibius marinus]|uniref:ATP-binding response regulator n=1 Tax=Pelagibius marinus TaxID=2762760 RepID=UPI001872C214|nr:ATP-binding protein [Pelagibius marinus]